MGFRRGVSEGNGCSRACLVTRISEVFPLALDALYFDVLLRPIFGSQHRTTRKRHQIFIKRVTGVLTPHQVADLTLAEAKDIVPVLSIVLTPIFGAIGILGHARIYVSRQKF